MDRQKASGTPTAFTLVTTFWKCSALIRKNGKVAKPCHREATLHVTDAGDAPYCREHADRVMAALRAGKQLWSMERGERLG